jgi:tRNA pseudouridine13 synthase
MKVKQSPDDFRVEELTDAVPAQGDYAFYRLDKTGWTTPDALAAVRRMWRIDGDRLSYGGLKDRHAVTSQYVSIVHGPRENLSAKGWSLTYLGQVPDRYDSKQIRANRFAVVIRNLHPWQVTRAEQAAADVQSCGVPNYFDDQRFGSVNADRRFVAKEMVAGRFEEALKLALTGPYEYDRAVEKREKAALRANWGRWSEAKAALNRGHARSLVDYLVHHPTDFRGACARLRPDLRGLYLSAYQSDLWNRHLSKWLQAHVPAGDLTGIELKLGIHAVPKRVPAEWDAEWKSATLPLLSARLKADPEAPWWPTAQAALEEEGLTLDQLRIKGIDHPYFSKGDRAVCLVPSDFGMTAEADDRHRGRSKLTLRFELPRGCYATMIVKRLTATKPFGERPVSADR